MGTFKGGADIVSPGSWQASSCLSLASTLLDSIFINYFHRNKYITYTLDDQEIWQPEKNYMSQEDNCALFFLITVFLNLHPSPGFPSTVLRRHSALILGFLYLLQPLVGAGLWAGAGSTHHVECLFLVFLRMRKSLLDQALVRQVYHLLAFAVCLGLRRHCVSSLT